MRVPKIHSQKGPEEEIVQDILKFLRMREWLVKRTHGNMYQSGFPDLYCAHRRYGPRWVEVKNPKKYCFTPAQMEFFPQLSGAGIGIWILVAATESEYAKLFSAPNWYFFLNVLR